MAITLSFDDLNEQLETEYPALEFAVGGEIVVFPNIRLQDQAWRSEFKERYETLWPNASGDAEAEDAEGDEAEADEADSDETPWIDGLVDLLRFVCDSGNFEVLVAGMESQPEGRRVRMWTDIFVSWMKDTQAGEA